jgi:transcription elongation factor GreB
MRKGFTRRPEPDAPGPLVKNYITPSGLERLKDEHRFLLTRERPAVTEVAGGPSLRFLQGWGEMLLTA